MKSKLKSYSVTIMAFVLVANSDVASAQVFDSGSDGSYGPITAGVLQIPDDGIFNATTVNINGALTFTKNARNTPVYILATGDVIITASEYIDVSGSQAPGGLSNEGGAGGPGGFDGGSKGVSGFDPGDGMGPGGGTQLLMPLVGGSGGGGTQSGGGGGGAGAIVIASNTEIRIDLAEGSGNVRGVFAVGGGGSPYASGGAIRLIAPKIYGNGTLCAGKPGRSGSQPCPTTPGGVGRVRIDTIDRSEYQLYIHPDTPQTHGTLMQVFPTTSPALDIIEVAGTTVPEGSTTPVDIFLPDGSPSSQDVIVQASDFTGVVPITVKVTPDSGASVAYDDSIDMGDGNPSTTTVSVQIPVNVPVRVHAWTRDP